MPDLLNKIRFIPQQIDTPSSGKQDLVLFAGLIVTIVAAHSLSSVEQGYLFTFISMAAAQTLFELGIISLVLH